MTQVYNRLYLNDRLPQELARAKRYGTLLSLVFCDLDHFKRINDCYGHLVGDRVLVAFSHCLKQHIRENIDWVVRFGGEEFLVILPNTSPEDACRIGERIRNCLGNLSIPVQLEEVRVTASFGITSWPVLSQASGLPTPEELFQKADAALYQAKREGRDRVCYLPH